jgi:hypothetical protein
MLDNSSVSDIYEVLFTRCDFVASSLRMPQFIIIRPFFVDSSSSILPSFLESFGVSRFSNLSSFLESFVVSRIFRLFFIPFSSLANFRFLFLDNLFSDFILFDNFLTIFDNFLTMF